MKYFMGLASVAVALIIFSTDSGAALVKPSDLVTPDNAASVRNAPGGAALCCGLTMGPITPDPDADLPVNPSIDQQIAAGQKRILELRESDQTLDGDSALVAYFNDLVKRLIAAQDIKPPYPIVVHVSTAPLLNAYASVGGQIIVYSRIFEEADNEAQLVAILGHELSHEIHDDYAFFWNASQGQEDSYGQGGLLERSRGIETRADLDATRMMYGAGWDPEEQVKMMMRISKMAMVARGNHRIEYSTHPDDQERIEAVKKLIGSFSPKPNLAKDSQSFRDLKDTM
ncbi:MAG: M48 family metalloprotease [Candidatus Binataceae bacterium]